LASSGEAAGFVFVTERMRLFSAPHPQLSVIPPYDYAGNAMRSKR
jgi:hypothetical protein